MLRDLSETPRSISSVDFSTKLTKTFSEQPVPEWAEVVNNGDYAKDMFVNFGCLVSTVCNVLLPEYVSDRLMKFLAFNLLSAKSADFVYNKYNPNIVAALRDIKPKIPHDEIVIMGRRFIGMIMKIGFSFAFQEEFPPIPFLWGRIPNEIGALILPAWNKLSSDISGVP